MIRITFCLIAILCSTLFTNSQTLSSWTLTNSCYVQHFDSLYYGLPEGWHVFTGSTKVGLGRLWDTSIGNKLLLQPVYSQTNGSRWTSSSGNFRNVASANNSSTFSPFVADSAGQMLSVDRALGVRQVAAGNSSFPRSDSGAAFAFKMSDTKGKSAFRLEFKLQSLDSGSGRTTIWQVDYGMGDEPQMFIPAPIVNGTMATGGYAYSNHSIEVDFQNALDDRAEPVWIRIVTLNISSGTGNRATTAIDDFMLTYADTLPVIANIGYDEIHSNKSILFASSNYTCPQVVCNIPKKDSYTLRLYDLNGRLVYLEQFATHEGLRRSDCLPLPFRGIYLATLRSNRLFATARLVFP